MRDSEKQIKEKHNKKWYILAGLFLSILVAGMLLMSFIAEPMLLEKLEERGDMALGPDADLQIGNLSIGYFPLSVTLGDIDIGPAGSLRDADGAKITTVDRIHLSGFSLRKFLMDETISIRSITISEADLHILPERVATLFRSDDERDESGSDIEIGRVSVTRSHLNVYRVAENNAYMVVSDFKFEADDLNLSAGTDRLSEIVRSVEFNAESLSYLMESGHYRLEIDKLTYSLQSGSFTLDHFRMVPLMTPHELPETLGHQTDHFDITSGRIQIRDIRMDEWFESNEIVAGAILVDDLGLSISRDKNFPDKPRTELPLLNKQFFDFKFAASIDTLIWNGGSIAYREMEEEQNTFAEIKFTDLAIHFSKIQNRNRSQNIRANARSKLMGGADLNVEFDFSLADNAAHHVKGELGKMYLTELNPVLEPLAFARIKEGQLHSLNFDFRADNMESVGSLTAIYEDLSFRTLDKETLEESTGNNIISYLANAVVIRSSNSENGTRIGEIKFEREKDRSIFNYWWKSLRTGLKSTALRI